MRLWFHRHITSCYRFSTIPLIGFNAPVKRGEKHLFVAYICFAFVSWGGKMQSVCLFPLLESGTMRPGLKTLYVNKTFICLPENCPEALLISHLWATLDCTDTNVPLELRKRCKTVEKVEFKSWNSSVWSFCFGHRSKQLSKLQSLLYIQNG